MNTMWLTCMFQSFILYYCELSLSLLSETIISLVRLLFVETIMYCVDICRILTMLFRGLVGLGTNPTSSLESRSLSFFPGLWFCVELGNTLTCYREIL